MQHSIMLGKILPGFLMLAQVISATDTVAKPNIIFILADDLGWNDVSWTNPDIISPNLEGMARGGVILNQSYALQLCSPSRSALLSGMFPYHIGMQRGVIGLKQAYGLPLNLSTIPDQLKLAGYSTHMIGKWHQGFCSWPYTPTRRGFDTFYGFYTAETDYFQHSIPLHPSPHLSVGLDFRDNETTVRDQNGTYSTYLYTKRAEDIIKRHNTKQPMFMYLAYGNVHEPLQVPKKYEDMYPRLMGHDRRRKYSGMVTAMDESIGAVKKALEDSGMMKNTIILFVSDNGAQYRRGGNNFPLRGNKGTVWEGGTRVPSFIYGDALRKSGYTYSGMMHMVDWYPTILEVAGAPLPNYELDGKSLWKAINNDIASPRNSFVYNLDVKGAGRIRAAIRVGDWKLIIGLAGPWTGLFDYNGSWYPPPNTTVDASCTPPPDTTGESRRNARQAEEFEDDLHSRVRRDEEPKIQLFNIREDPTEHRELSKQHPVIVNQMKEVYNKFAATEVQATYPGDTPNADPRYWGGEWTPGWC